jgi:excinuclease ABC subunit A
MTEPTHIVVRGAQEHNLRDLSVSLPRNRLVVFTGVSGSGKSSLAFDTIHQEGQRRFMESLSAYARQFLGRMERPRVESVEGVSPTVSIDQKTVNRNPRSTVGTVTELYDHLRLLMARLGTPACPECGSEVGRRSVGQLVESLLESAAGERLMVLAPIVRDRKGEHRKELEELARQGWARARVDGQICRTEEPPELARYEKHTIEVVVDRVRALPAERGRLTEALETAVRLAGGVVTLLHGEAEDERSYAVERACAKHPELSFPEMEPRLFSFNAPQGACPTCTGLGAIEGFDWDRLIDLDASSSACFRGFNDEGRLPFAHFDEAELGRVIGRLGGDPKKPLRAWPPERAAALIDGDPSVILKQTIVSADGRAEQRERPWRGLRPLVEMVWKYTGYVGLARFRCSRPCETCAGTRLNPFARAVHFRGRGVAELGRLSVRDARAFFDGLSLEGDEAKVGALLVREIRDRLVFLDEVGLGYLGLDRSAATLSGGEAQRIRLAAQVGSALQGVTYVLDEPSIGLHPRDNARLLQSLLRLRDRGNSVLVVEHDHETVEAADWVIDVGPGAASSSPPGPPRSSTPAMAPPAASFAATTWSPCPRSGAPGTAPPCACAARGSTTCAASTSISLSAPSRWSPGSPDPASPP